jgi:hypothetical protein
MVVCVVIILLALIYSLNIVDYAQTIYAIQLFGLSIEVNPIGRFMLGNDSAWIFKLIIMPIMLTILGLIVKVDKKQMWAVCFLLIYFLCLVIHNFFELVKAGAF